MKGADAPFWASAHRLARAVGARLERAPGQVPASSARRPRIIALGSHGTNEAVTVRLRVLEDPPPNASSPEDPRWWNAWTMLQRLETDEVTGVTVRARMGRCEATGVTDGEGLVELTLEPDPDDLVPGSWQAALAWLEIPGQEKPQLESVPVLVPDASARFGVISDIDDTVIRTGARRLLDLAWTTLTGNPTTRQAFDGVDRLYQGLHRGPDGEASNPFFYVSSSPWGLQEFLDEVLRLRGVPAGPLFLRDLDLVHEVIRRGASRHERHKLGVITRILERHVDLPFVLIGDSGQHDPEIYTQVVERWPERIRTVLIRDVTPDLRDAEVRELALEAAKAGVELVLAADSASMAVACRRLGLLAG